MEHTVGARKRVGAMSRVACAACRRLKMKCIGAEKPPCARCAKTGRFCIISQSNQQQRTPVNIRYFQNSSQHCPPSTPQTLRYVPDCPEKEPSPEHDARLNLKPLIYRTNTTPVPVSGPGFESIASQGHWSAVPLHAARLHSDPAFQFSPTDPVYSQSRRITNAWPVAGDTNGDCADKTFLDDALNGVVRDGPSLPSDEEIFHLSRFFITNLLHHIPVITEHDLTGLGTTPGVKRALAYCMAYVAARFMPGCKAIQIALTSSVAPIARLQLERYHDGESTEESRWTQLQALAILYNWAPSQSGTTAIPDNFPAELRQDMLRASIETLARRHSLHRSAAEVTELLRLNIQNFQQSFAFRKYLYWLWLFSEAHFHALVSQSPPSIREDASIMQAAQLPDNIANDDCARQILARVELCLLWSRAAFRERNLSEWWSSVPTQMNLESSLALLDDVDAATRSWYQKWHPPEKASFSQKAARAGKDDTTRIYYHFTCSYIGNHIARAIQSSTIAESLPLSRIHSLTKTVDRSNTLCRFFLELSPLAKYSVCFSPEIVYAMIAACCESLLQILGLTGELGLGKPVHLSTIRHVAELMVDLSIDEKQGAKGRGQHILARLRENEAIRRPSVPQRPTAHHKRSMTWTAGGGEQQAAHTLLSFMPVTDDVLSAQQVLNQRELTNGHQQGFTSGPGEGIGMWASYHASEPVGSADWYWTS